jgi:hypothetical protein
VYCHNRRNTNTLINIVVPPRSPNHPTTTFGDNGMSDQGKAPGSMNEATLKEMASGLSAQQAKLLFEELQKRNDIQERSDSEGEKERGEGSQSDEGSDERVETEKERLLARHQAPSNSGSSARVGETRPEEGERENAGRRSQERSKGESLSDDERSVETAKSKRTSNSKAYDGTKDPRAKAQVIQGIRSLLQKVPMFEDNGNEVPGDLYKALSRARQDAFQLYTEDELTVDKIILMAARDAMPATSRAGAWFERWESTTESAPTFKEFGRAYAAEFMSHERKIQWNVKFQERKQDSGESPMQYLKALRDFGKMAAKSEDDLLAQFRTGLTADLIDALAPIRPKTLQDALDVAEATWQRAQQKKKTSTSLAMAAFDKREARCHTCQGVGHFKFECPSSETKEKKGSKKDDPKKFKFKGKCRYCDITGHKEVECRKKKRDESQKKAETPKKEEDAKGGFTAADMASKIAMAAVSIGQVEMKAVLDLGATDGAYVDEEVGAKMKWHRKPDEHGTEITALGAGATARWGEAEIAIGGQRDIFKVAISPNLNGKARALLGLNTFIKFGISPDWDKMMLKVGKGKRVPFTLERVQGAAHVAFVAQSMQLGAGEGTWLRLRGTGLTDGPVHIEPIPNEGSIFALDSISMVKSGEIYVPIQNYGEEEMEIKAGRAVAAFTAVKEVEGKNEMKIFVKKDKSWPSEDPEREAKERAEAEERENKRKLVTDEELKDYLKEHCADLPKAEQDHIFEQILEPFREIWLRKGELPVKPINYPYVNIRMTGGPVQAPIRNWNAEKYELVGAEAKKLNNAGILEDSISPWRSEWVMVEKTGGGVRPTTDLRSTLNKHTIFDAFPMPRIDEQLRKMAGCNIYSTCDAGSGYFQLGLAFGSREPTAVRVPEGLKQFTRVPMGSSVSGAKFVRAVKETIMDNLEPKTREVTANYVVEL